MLCLTPQPTGAVEVTIEIVASSPKALEAAKKTGTKGSPVYPFDKLEVNQSFRLTMSEANLASLQVMTSRKSRGGKVFKLIKHEEIDVAEVARIA